MISATCCLLMSAANCTRPVAAAAAAVCASREQEALLQLGGIEFLGLSFADWLFFLVHCVHVVALGSCSVSVNSKGPQTVTCSASIPAISCLPLTHPHSDICNKLTVEAAPLVSSVCPPWTAAFFPHTELRYFRPKNALRYVFYLSQNAVGHQTMNTNMKISL